MMGALDACLEPEAGYTVFDVYDGLAALLRICETVSRQPQSPLMPWLPRAQGYLNVALKHLPEIGGEDYAQRSLARQWRAADLLQRAVPVCARWLEQQLILECSILAAHPEFHLIRAALPADALAVVFLARRRAGGAGLFKA